MRGVITAELVDAANPHETRVHVTGPWGGADLFIEASVEVDNRSLTPWLAALVPIAMATNHNLRLNGPVDTATLEGTHTTQMLLSTMHPRLKQVEVLATSHERCTPTAEGLGCFFSGGVDSFYSVLRRRDEVTDLIYVQGFDVGLDDSVLFELVKAHLLAAASDLGKPLVLVRSNLRSLSDGCLEWGAQYHGAALASIALALRPVVHTVLIAGTHQIIGVHRWGSQPLLDAAWSSTAVQVRHESPDVRRVEKVRQLVDDQLAMRHLRVCWENPDGDYNCGRCMKCVRTMVTLEAVGGLGRCVTLPDRIDPTVLRHYRWRSGGDIFYVEENLAALRTSPHAPPELVAEMRRTLRCSRAMLVVRSFLRRLRPLIPGPVVRAIRLTNRRRGSVLRAR